jgi:hypothetical protein
MTANPSGTPRTNAAKFDTHRFDSTSGEDEIVVPVWLSEELERELAAAQALLSSQRTMDMEIARLHAELTAAQTEIETLRKDAIPESCWLVRSLGGEGPPMHAFCRDTDEVRRAIGELIWGDYGHAEKEELDQHMMHFADPDNWGSEGTHWIIQFEIDGIEAILLDKHAAIDAAKEQA